LRTQPTIEYWSAKVEWTSQWQAAQRELKAASLAYYKIRSMPKDQRRILGGGDYALRLASARHRFKAADTACFELRRVRKDRPAQAADLRGGAFPHSA
jgi:hypothetical protein